MITSVHARRDAIRRLIRSQVIGTQEQLGRLLEKDGIEVTQATLSRDLGALTARRVQLSQGGTAYELDDAPVSGGAEGLRAVHALVTTVDESDAMVVLRTRPGAASIVAAAIDAGRPAGVLGTLAGDDTIFIVPTKGTRPARVANQLRTIWRKAKG